MIEGLVIVFWGVVTFSVLVVIHEAGHFLAARAFGVKVHEFMVGLPGPSLRFHGRKTTYGITAIPLGGYVRIAGMEPGPEDPLLGPALAYVTRVRTCDRYRLADALSVSDEVAEQVIGVLKDWDAVEPLDEDTVRSRFSPERADEPDVLLSDARSVTYRALKLWQRIVLLTAGVVLNLVTAVLVLTVVFSVVPYGKDTGRIARVGPGSAAEKAGLAVGDRVLSVDGIKVADFEDLVFAVARFKAGESVSLVVDRGGKTVRTMAVLDRNPDTGRGLLGVSPEMVATRAGPVQALKLSFGYLWLTLTFIVRLFDPRTFVAAKSLSSSVIGASVMAANAARAGLPSYAGLVGALSFSLGGINIVPLPPLDGGKVAIEIIEALRGRQISRKVNIGLSLAGAAVLFMLVGVLMYADIVRIVAG